MRAIVCWLVVKVLSLIHAVPICYYVFGARHDDLMLVVLALAAAS